MTDHRDTLILSSIRTLTDAFHPIMVMVLDETPEEDAVVMRVQADVQPSYASALLVYAAANLLEGARETAGRFDEDHRWRVQQAAEQIQALADDIGKAANGDG